MAYYHVCSTSLHPGSIILPGNWGRIIRVIGPAHNHWTFETALEEIRKTEFPHLPSRLESAFFFDSEPEARLYQQEFAQLTILYEVEPTETDVAMHRADHRGVIPDGELSLEWARRYWRGLTTVPHPSGLTCTELLAVVPLRIIRALT